MPARRPDAASLAAGIAVLVIALLMLLDERGSIDLSFAVFAPVACAAIGAVFLAAGLSRR
ncbi:MAG: hypothetical protein JW895_01815 [Thermoleophilaceae bacterium]|nr:hypothetical protein [Thermoleophilaceae bacterium]